MRIRAAILLILAAAALESSAQWPGSPASFAAWWSGSQLSIPADGLVFWHRPGTTLSTNAYFGASYPATLILGVTITSDGYYNVDNNSSFVSIPPLPLPSDTAFTLTAWIKVQIATPQYFFANSGEGGVGNGFRVYCDASGAILFQFMNGPSSYRGRKTPNETITTNWTHYSFVYSGGTVTNPANFQVWKNGARVDNANLTTGGNPSWSNVTNRFILRNYQNGGGEMRGAMDEVAVWTRALSSNEINAVMAATRGTKQ